MQRLLSVVAVGAVLASCGGPSDPAEPVIVDAAKGAFTAAGQTALRSKTGAADRPLVVQVRLIDDYGRHSHAPVITLSWTKADLEKVNWPEMSDSKMANLAKVRIDGRYGVIAFAEWCGEYELLTPRLCQDERSSAEEEWSGRAP